MSDVDHLPKRLIDTTEDAFLQSVLRSAKDDEPVAGARDALLASLGVAGVAGLSTLAPGASALVRWGGGAKWFVLTSVGLGVVAVGAAIVSMQASQAPPASIAHVPVVALSGGWPKVEPVTVPSVTRTMTDESRSPRLRAQVPSAPVPAPKETAVVENVTEPVATAAAASAEIVDAHRLSEELKVLEAARLAAKRGDQAAALAALDKHAEERDGALKVEELVLRVQTLARSGDRSGAQAALHALQASGASAAHLSRARAAIAAMPQ